MVCEEGAKRKQVVARLLLGEKSELGQLAELRKIVTVSEGWYEAAGSANE